MFIMKEETNFVIQLKNNRCFIINMVTTTIPIESFFFYLCNNKLDQ